MRYDRVEQIWEGALGDGLEGNFWEEGLPLCVQSRFECLHGRSGHNILWQLVQVCDYSDTERMLANLQSMNSKPSADGGSKGRVTWKVEEAVLYFLHADKVTTNSSTD